jgi:hypothetical protein
MKKDVKPTKVRAKPKPKPKVRRKPRAKATTNMVQKVNVKVNNGGGGGSGQIAPIPHTSVVQVPQLPPNMTNLIPHQQHANPFDSVAFADHLNTKINSIVDLRIPASSIRETAAPLPNPVETVAPATPVESIIDPPIAEPLYETPAKREKWTFDPTFMDITSQNNGDVISVKSWRQGIGTRSNNFYDDSTGMRFNTKSGRLFF